MSVHPNRDLLESFYAALARRDGDTMAACYHPDATFSDPAFVGLTGEQAGAMWRMLTTRGKDLEVEWQVLDADDSSGRARWTARYTFSGTGRRVVNEIESSFRFRAGRIASQEDRFDLWRWTRQALGLPGLLLGWSPWLQGKVRRQAMAGLRAWQEGSRPAAS